MELLTATKRIEYRRIMTTTAQDKRTRPRTSRPVCAWLRFGTEEPPYGALSIDLSAGGARFGALRRVRAGDRVLVSVQLPFAVIECKGQVRWSKRADNGLQCFGVQFVDLQDNERAQLKRYVQQTTRPERVALGC
jgi:c-di-GMP-binding flagellar brake protein YcgR